MAAPASVTLRAATAADLDRLCALAAHEAVEPSLAMGAADGLADAVARGEVLVAEAGGAFVGAVRAVMHNRRSRIAAIRTLMVDPGRRGRGLGLAIVRAVVARLVGEQDVHRVEAEVYGFNDAGLRLFASAGFAREGTRRRAYDRHGAWQDGVLFAYLADEAKSSG